MTSFKFICLFVQSDSGGKVNILGGDITRHCGGKKFVWTCA